MRLISSIIKFVKVLMLLAAILMSILVYRAINFVPNYQSVEKIAPIPMDYLQAAERLAVSVRFKTISQQEPKKQLTQPFLDFHHYLEQSFPLVHSNLELEKVNEFSLLYRWKGQNRSNQKPVLYMAHFDVVPVDPSTLADWKYPPFEGVVDDEIIWGRGVLDDKGAVMAILESTEYLLSQGFQPNRDIYFAFGHDEEIGGERGAKEIAKHLQSKNIEFEYLLDEGGFVTKGMMPGVDFPLALIGVAEKGYVSVKLSVQSEGGHSSVPPKSTSIGILSRAIVQLENAPFKARLVNATENMLETIGRHLPFSKRIIFANLWLFRPFVIDQLTEAKLTNATIRTTMAATVFQAGEKENALPINASAIVNLRLLPGDKVEDVKAHFVATIGDPRVKVEVLRGAEATSISSIDSAFYQQLVRIIDQVSPEQGMVIVPNLLVGGTDSKHFMDLADNVYRFNGVKITPESFSGFHGTNEYLLIKEYQRAINFYYQLLKLN